MVPMRPLGPNTQTILLTVILVFLIIIFSLPFFFFFGLHSTLQEYLVRGWDRRKRPRDTFPVHKTLLLPFHSPVKYTLEQKLFMML